MALPLIIPPPPPVSALGPDRSTFVFSPSDTVTGFEICLPLSGSASMM